MAKISEIISLGAENFNSGVARGYFSTARGLWYEAYGVKTFGSAGESRDGNIGYLRLSDTGTELGDGTITQAIRAATNHASSASGSMYFLAGSTTGHFYKLTSGDVVTNLRSGTTITDANYGIEIFKPAGGTEYLYYWQDTQIGRWDLSGTYPTGWVDNHFTGLDDVNHFTHKFFGDIYYTNGDTIGKIYDNAGTAANNTNVLDFPSEYSAKCLTDDGTYLVIGVTTKNSSNSFIGLSKVLFWDTFSPSWNKEFTIPDGSIASLTKVGNIIYAIGESGVYALNYNSEPELSLVLKAGESILDATGATAWNNCLVFLSDNGNFDNWVGMLGSPYFGLPFAYHQVFTLPAIGYFITPKDDDNLLVYTGNGLYEFNLNNGGSGTDLELYTINFDIRKRWAIKGVVIYFADTLSSGESVAVGFQKISGGSITTWGTASYANHGAVDSVELPLSTEFVSHQFSLKLTINGSPLIRRISIYGEEYDDF